MATNTLTDRSTGQVILATFFNDLHDALKGDFVGRNSGSGAAESGKNLGTNALPWGTLYATSLNINGSSLDTSSFTAPANRIVSGATRSGSNQPKFLTPNGAAASFTVDGTTTNLVLDINGATATVSTDITKSSLTVGPSTTATAIVNDADAADQTETRIWGEYGAEKETITVASMGAEFQAFIGEYQIIQIAGTSTEYALAYIKSTTELTDIYRGWFFNSSGAPVQRAAFSNSDVITVLSTGWVFVENDGTTVDVSYKTPIRSFTSPNSPATGDYWYDMTNDTWKRYDGASWQIINRTLVGAVGIDSSNCVCARSFDFFKNFKADNTAELEVSTTEIVKMKNKSCKVNVYGTERIFDFNQESWNITTDLASSAEIYNASEQASTDYYLYLADTGDTVITDVEPQWRPDLKGWYNPHNTWRCVGVCFNSSGSDIVLAGSADFESEGRLKSILIQDQKSTTTAGGTFTSGAWTARVLNTTEDDTELALLSSNQFTLLPGKYLVEAVAQAKEVNNHALRIEDVTNSAVEILGQTSNANSSGVTNTASLYGVIVVPETRAFELQHRAETTRATDGYGEANSFGLNEIFATVKITQIRR